MNLSQFLNRKLDLNKTLTLMWQWLLNIWGLGRGWTPWKRPYGLQDDTRANGPKDCAVASWQILNVHLFRWFPSSPNEFGLLTSAIGSSLKLSFHPYKEHPKRTPYAAHASILVRAASGLRDELELEFLWASTLDTRTESTSGLLLDLDTLDGFVGLHAILQIWLYPWMSCPHQFLNWVLRI